MTSSLSRPVRGTTDLTPRAKVCPPPVRQRRRTPLQGAEGALTFSHLQSRFKGRKVHSPSPASNPTMSHSGRLHLEVSPWGAKHALAFSLRSQGTRTPLRGAKSAPALSYPKKANVSSRDGKRLRFLPSNPALIPAGIDIPQGTKEHCHSVECSYCLPSEK